MNGMHASIGSLTLGLLLVGLTACGGDDGDSGATAPTAGSGSGSAGGAPAVEKQTVDPATVGSIRGVVSFSGEVPSDTLMTTADPWCAGHTGGEMPDNAVIVNGDKLQNAVAWIAEGLEDYDFGGTDTPVKLDQQGCAYIPRVLAVQVKQPVMVHTSDPVLHNVNVKAKINKRKNIGMPPDAPPQELVFKKAEMAVPFQCDVHPWMGAAIAVVDHPCFAVSGADGAFVIEGVPPGDYVLEIWHERLGTVRADVTVGASEEVTAPSLVFQG